MRKKAAEIGLGIFAVVLCIALLEITAAYLFDHLEGRIQNGKRIVQILMDQKPDVPARIEPHPYLLYQNAKNDREFGYQQHNSYGYRNEEFELERGGVSTRILAVGGSTTHMFPYVKNPADTWVGQLEKKLRVAWDERVQVINGGIPYGTTAELLAGYVFRNRYLEPDILIVHTGGNDIVPLMFENYDPEYTHFRAHGGILVPRRFESAVLEKSGTARLFYAFWLNHYPGVYHPEPMSLRFLDRAETLSKVRSNESVGFRRNLGALIRFAKADGVEVILFGFLQAREEFLSSNRPIFQGLERAWVVGLDKHYRIMRELSEEYDVPFIIPDQDRFEDSWFIDNCHLNEQGEAVKAEILFEFMKDRESLRGTRPLAEPAAAGRRVPMVVGFR